MAILFGVDNTEVANAHGRTTAQQTAGYYNRPVSKWASYQRALCNKCHAKD